MKRTLIDLIRKYDKPGPRYTSYPPAPAFSNEFGAGAFTSALGRVESSNPNPDLSLYVHVPFCDTLCYFCGCTTIITRNLDHLQTYLGYLKKEIDLLGSAVNRDRRVVQLHWGGGTPTYFNPSQILELGVHIHNAFAFRPDAEVSVEIDPRELTPEHCDALRDAGFRRASLGVQDFDADVQRAVNRNQSEATTRRAIDWIRSRGFTSLNVDLIYGLPLQTVDSFTRTLDNIIEISPDRIAVYNFAYVPWMKQQQTLIHPEDLPSPEVKLELLTTTIDMLTEAGYEYIGMDHFAKPGDELTRARKNKTLHRNFQGYSTKAGSDLYGLGMSAISHFDSYYAQNAKTLNEYYDAIGRGNFATHVGYRMNSDDLLRKHVIMRLMCDLSIDKREVEEAFHISFDGYFGEALQELAPLTGDGLIESSDDRLTVTMDGRLFLRNIAMCFDAHLAARREGKMMYSRTV